MAAIAITVLGVVFFAMTIAGVVNGTPSHKRTNRSVR